MSIENPMPRRSGRLDSLAQHEHLCLIYEAREEQFAAVIPFLRGGLERGERCLYFADENPAEAILDALRAEGVDADDAVRTGRLAFPPLREPEGRRQQLDPARIIRYLEENAAAARAEGAAGLRVSYEMTWILKENPPLYLLMEFESTLNDFFMAHDALAICQYNRKVFPPEVILEAIRAHPLVSREGLVCVNPYYVPPVSLLSPTDAAQEVERLLRTVTEHERAERNLRESEERCRRLLSAVTSYNYTVTMENNRAASTWHGPGCEAVTGYQPEDYARNPLLWFSMIHDEDRGTALERIERTLKGEEVPPFEHRIYHRDGSIRWIRNTVSPCRDETGRLVRYDGVVEDISERKRAEQVIIQASRMEATATLAGGIAHDFNNLMMSVMGNAELLLAQFPDRPAAREMLEDISRIAGRAGELAHQMVAFARGGKYVVRNLKLNEIVHQALRNRKLSFSQVRVEQSLDPGLHQIEGDPTQISQVLVSILSNALEAIGGDGHIRVRTKNVQVDDSFPEPRPSVPSGAYICVSIADDGCGMNPEVKAKVFEPFFTTKFQGRGLGLAAAYGIVSNHGGDILVSSEEGAGAVFSVYLPAVEEHEEAATLPPSDEIPRGTETVLLVDDEEVVLEVTERLLSHLGYRALPCLRGAEALEMARSCNGEIHAALIDVFMPDMRGTELVPLLREARPGMKIVLCSGYAEGDAVPDTSGRESADAFLQKPLQLRTLGREMRRILEAAPAPPRD